MNNRSPFNSRTRQIGAIKIWNLKLMLKKKPNYLLLAMLFNLK